MSQQEHTNPKVSAGPAIPRERKDETHKANRKLTTNGGKHSQTPTFATPSDTQNTQTKQQAHRVNKKEPENTSQNTDTDTTAAQKATTYTSLNTQEGEYPNDIRSEARMPVTRGTLNVADAQHTSTDRGPSTQHTIKTVEEREHKRDYDASKNASSQVEYVAISQTTTSASIGAKTTSETQRSLNPYSSENAASADTDSLQSQKIVQVSHDANSDQSKDREGLPSNTDTDKSKEERGVYEDNEASQSTDKGLSFTDPSSFPLDLQNTIPHNIHTHRPLSQGVHTSGSQSAHFTTQSIMCLSHPQESRDEGGPRDHNDLNEDSADRDAHNTAKFPQSEINGYSEAGKISQVPENRTTELDWKHVADSDDANDGLPILKSRPELLTSPRGVAPDSEVSPTLKGAQYGGSGAGDQDGEVQTIVANNDDTQTFGAKTHVAVDNSKSVTETPKEAVTTNNIQEDRDNDETNERKQASKNTKTLENKHFRNKQNKRNKTDLIATPDTGDSRKFNKESQDKSERTSAKSHTQNAAPEFLEPALGQAPVDISGADSSVYDYYDTPESDARSFTPVKKTADVDTSPEQKAKGGNQRNDGEEDYPDVDLEAPWGHNCSRPWIGQHWCTNIMMTARLGNKLAECRSLYAYINCLSDLITDCQGFEPFATIADTLDYISGRFKLKCL